MKAAYTQLSQGLYLRDRHFIGDLQILLSNKIYYQVLGIKKCIGCGSISYQGLLNRCVYRQKIKIRSNVQAAKKIPVATNVGEIPCVVKAALSNRDCNIYFKPTVRCFILPVSQEPRKG